MKKPSRDSAEVRKSLKASADVLGTLAGQAETIARAARAIVACLKRGGKVLAAGNGGSAAEALHLSEELIGRFQSNRRALPSVALVADPTALTCIANDFGYDAVFSRQVEGLGARGDVLVLFSTSGRAPNLAQALERARGRGMTTICLLGRDGGPLAGKGDIDVIVPGSDTARIQEAHQVIVHIVLEFVERAFGAAG